MAAEDGVRRQAYETPDPCADTLDTMNKRLSHDLRQRVRRMGIAEPLSGEWMDMAEIVAHLGQIAAMEAKDVERSEKSTAWERNELCIRFIIEEGKINLMLRSMVRFKEWYYEALEKGVAWDEEQMQRMRMFETGLSTLLRHALNAEEALQTIDLTLLLEHIQRVLKYATDLGGKWMPHPGCPPQGYQEIAVVGYMHSILRQSDKLADEDKVLTQVLDMSIVPLTLKHYEQYHDIGGGMTQEVIEDYIWFLAFLMSTEHWATHRKDYLPDKESKANLVCLEDAAKAVKAAEAGGTVERRKLIRGLCDYIIRVK